MLPQNNALLREQQLKHMEEYLTEAIRTAEVLKLSKSELQDVLGTLWDARE